MDRYLIERAQHGDETAFATIAAAIGNRMYATAEHILRDPPRAADAVQDALIEIWQRLPTLREPASFEAWVYRILIRRAFAEARRRNRWLRFPMLGRQPRMLEPDFAAVVTDRDQLDRALGSLPIGHRAVVVLKHYLGLSNAEIADTLDVPEGTVRSRLHYSMTAMRAALEADNRPGARSVAPWA